jgi:hypothetical protein
MNYWKIYCEETKYPGLWARWYKNQCAAVGWNPNRGFTLEGESQTQDWSMARNYLKRIKPGDKLVVQLKHNRVGRVGEVVRNESQDKLWNATVPPSKKYPTGHHGRRIALRWDLNIGPTDPDTVVLLPATGQLSPNLRLATIRELDSKTFNRITEAMKNKDNWVGLQGRFDYERSLSDWIATYPHQLEDGLMPHPYAKLREKTFPDKSRSDVILVDEDEVPVVVECKQHAPTLKDVTQLRGYMRRVRKMTGKKTRGILVHGGTASLRDDVRREVDRDRFLEVIRYSLHVDFTPCN